MNISIYHCGKKVAFVVAKIEEKSDGIYVYDNTGSSIRLSSGDMVHAHLEHVGTKMVINYNDLFSYFMNGDFHLR